MDSALPTHVTHALDEKAESRLRKPGAFRVRAGEQEARVTELASDGFVIQADGRPPLRGYADIFKGDQQVLRGLVICSWAHDGLVGYEFKRGTTDGTMPVDYVRGPVAGLLPAR